MIFGFKTSRHVGHHIIESHKQETYIATIESIRHETLLRLFPINKKNYIEDLLAGRLSFFINEKLFCTYF